VNELLMRLTAAMPMKQINLDKFLNESHQLGSTKVTETVCVQTPYLQRYFAGTFRDGSDLWLHRFLSADGDRHLHSHPFEFESIILHGGYTEEFIELDGSKKTRYSEPSRLQDWANSIGITGSSLKKRISLWGIEKALTTPKDRSK